MNNYQQDPPSVQLVKPEDNPFAYRGAVLPSLFHNKEFLAWAEEVVRPNADDSITLESRKIAVILAMERLGPVPSEWHKALYQFIQICSDPKLDTRPQFLGGIQ